MTAVGMLSGHHITETVKEGESAFINKIVQDILGNIQPRSMEKILIGIEPRINELNLLLATEATQEVRMVGIWGMGGIGKTTIARALFRRISCKFEGSSFVKGVREKSKRDICALQEKILKDMTHHNYKITDVEDGAEMIQIRFCKKKILLVLDDVDDAKQLEFLAATHKWFGAGSRIIITTRDQHLLSDTNAIYKPAFLAEEHAVELFSQHAFRRNSPPEGYKELSNRAIRYTGGLPLALKVLGSFLHGRKPSVWESALDRLAKTPNVEIFETLRVSFDGLESSEKKIFLDIACFFKGHREERVARVLDSFGFDPTIGISALKEKCLITVSNEQIQMHDVLQEMGLEIVRNSYPNSRLWQCKEIHDFITKNTNLEVVEAIVPTYVDEDTTYENMGFSADIFEKMKNIRLLDIRGDFTSCKPTTLPDELRWLRWDRYPFSSLPLAHLSKLVGLEIIYGKIEHIWMEYKVMPNLKFIQLEDLRCVESFPDVSGAPNVERLILSGCTNLVEVHKSLGSLRKLAYLNMNGCWDLKCLPSLMEMPSLETIDLSYCLSLEKFVEVSSGMEKLSNIYLNGCSNLKIIPSSICELKNLKSLHLQECEQLQKLPEKLGSMENLEELWIGFVDHVTVFPRRPESINFHALTNLCCLRKLDLSWRQIEEHDFPNNFHAFSSLEELDLSGNCKLAQLPASISRLSCLKHLELNDCQQLQNIQALPSGIQVLKANNCGALEKIEDLTKEYVWLHKIFLSGCKMLLKNQESEKCLDNMLQKSLIEKCAAVDHVLSIAIPGNKIPSWFKEQRHGNQIALKSKCHTHVMGFVVCGVFQGERQNENVQTIGTTEIHFSVGNNRTRNRESKIDYINTSTAREDESLWIVYIPFSFIRQQMYDYFERDYNWSIFVKGNLVIRLFSPWHDDENYIRCGARLVYKDDVVLTQQINTSIPDYQNSNIVRRFGYSFAYIEKRRSIEL